MDIRELIFQFQEVHTHASRIWAHMITEGGEDMGFEQWKYSYRGQIFLCENGVILKLHAIFDQEEKDYLIPWVQFWAWNL